MAEAPSPGSKRPKQPPSGVRSRPSVAIIGTGAVGAALARRLRAAGYPIEAVLNRSARAAQQLAAEVGAPVASSALEALPQQATLLFLCVPDDQVRSVAQALAGQKTHPWQHCLVAHTAGALPAAALHSLAEAGAATLSFHPLQAFTQGATAEAFDGIHVGLEGGEEALLAGRSLAEALDVHAFVVTEAQKVHYHLAASMASNFLVSLLALAGEVLDGARPPLDSRGIDETAEGAERLRPLLEGTLRNVRDNSPEAALTGPAVRGDEETIAAHLQALDAHHPGLLPVYAALTTETVRLAARANRLSSAAADRLLNRLEAGMQSHSEVGS